MWNVKSIHVMLPWEARGTDLARGLASLSVRVRAFSHSSSYRESSASSNTVGSGGEETGRRGEEEEEEEEGGWRVQVRLRTGAHL